MTQSTRAWRESIGESSFEEKRSPRERYLLFGVLLAQDHGVVEASLQGLPPGLGLFDLLAQAKDFLAVRLGSRSAWTTSLCR